MFGRLYRFFFMRNVVLILCKKEVYSECMNQERKKKKERKKEFKRDMVR